jgi:hypothetical protein
MLGYICVHDEPSSSLASCRQQHDNLFPWGLPQSHFLLGRIVPVPTPFIRIPITSAVAVANTNGNPRIQKIQAFHQEGCPPLELSRHAVACLRGAVVEGHDMLLETTIVSHQAVSTGEEQFRGNTC